MTCEEALRLLGNDLVEPGMLEVLQISPRVLQNGSRVVQNDVRVLGNCQIVATYDVCAEMLCGHSEQAVGR